MLQVEILISASVSTNLKYDKSHNTTTLLIKHWGSSQLITFFVNTSVYDHISCHASHVCVNLQCHKLSAFTVNMFWTYGSLRK